MFSNIHDHNIGVKTRQISYL